MIEACHIRDFAESHIDIITNGIAISPHLQQAFDKGFFTIDENYSVVVSSKFEEEEASGLSIRQFHGKNIILPEIIRYHPSQEYFEWHRQHQFEKFSSVG